MVHRGSAGYPGRWPTSSTCSPTAPVASCSPAAATTPHGTATGESRSVSELVTELGISQPTVSKHLKVLRDHGLVAVREEGQHRYYRLDPAPLGELATWLAPVRERLAADSGMRRGIRPCTPRGRAPRSATAWAARRGDRAQRACRARGRAGEAPGCAEAGRATELPQSRCRKNGDDTRTGATWVLYSGVAPPLVLRLEPLQSHVSTHSRAACSTHQGREWRRNCPTCVFSRSPRWPR